MKAGQSQRNKTSFKDGEMQCEDHRLQERVKCQAVILNYLTLALIIREAKGEEML